MFIQEGTEVLLSDLLKGVIVSSGNDASVALAEYIAGSENAFADIMNQQASILGMSGTYYSNATGWPDDGHLTTARDLALLSRALINDYPSQYSIYAEKYFKFNNIDQTNRNSLLWRDSSVDGLKTGHTEKAGYCLVASATRKGMRLISVVMGAKSKAARAQESQKLLSYGFRYYETDKMYSAGDVVKKDAPVWYGTENKVNLVVSENVYLTIPQGSKKDLESKIVLNGIIEAPLTETQELGKMSVSLDKDTLAKFPIFAEHAVDEAGIFERLWDSLEIMFMGFFE
jgi:D-alanyl-D-alanine carboxypeptidase (penicillin-binding protein 5/6)